MSFGLELPSPFARGKAGLGSRMSLVLLALLLLANPTVSQQPEARPEVAETTGAGERRFLGSPAAIAPLDVRTVALEAGTRIYSEPDIRSLVLRRVDALIEVEQLDSTAQSAAADEGWRFVQLGGVRGWVAPPGLAPRSAAETWAAPTPNDEQLRRQRMEKLIETFGAPGRLGSFLLFTDLNEIADRGLLSFLDRVASATPEAYSERYGVSPRERVRAGSGSSGEEAQAAVVLFAKLRDYRRYLADELEMVDPGAAGVSPHGLAILAVGDRSRDRVAAILIHELTHELNRRVFGAVLPPWLEEGMAEDLSFHPLDGEGRLQLGELPEIRRRVQHRLLSDGSEVLERHQFTPPPRVAIACSLVRWLAEGGPGGGLRVESLTQLTSNQFSLQQGRSARYSDSAILVRYLLDGAGTATAEAFRRHLGLITREGHFFDLPSLLLEVDIEPQGLPGAIRSWARIQSVGVDCRR